MKIPVKPDRKEFRLSAHVVSGRFGYGIEIEDDPENKNGAQLSMPRGVFDAALWVNNGLAEFRSSARAAEMIGERWDTHPDKKTIDKWLSEVGANDDGLVIYFVSTHVLAEWVAIPARTVKEHRKLYGEIDETAKRLAALLISTEERYYRGGGHGLRDANVSALLTDCEKDEVLDVVEAWNEEHPAGETEDGRPIHKPANACFPSMEDLLERIAAAARRLHDAGPLHSQPNKKGARNGYFIRRMDGLLRQRYGKYPADVLAAIASIVLDAVIDADLVKKTVNVSERFGKKNA